MKFDPIETLSSNHFIKLGDKEKIKGVFSGEPFKFRQHWNEATQKSSVCTGKENSCIDCSKAIKASFRFRINFIVYDSESKRFVPKIFEQGSTVYKQLGALNENLALESSKIMIVRNGLKKETNYTFIPEGPLSESISEEIKGVKLHDLSVFEQAKNVPENHDFSDISF